MQKEEKRALFYFMKWIDNLELEQRKHFQTSYPLYYSTHGQTLQKLL